MIAAGRGGNLRGCLVDAQVQAGNLLGIHRRSGCDAKSQALVFDDRGRPSRKVDP